MVPYLCERSRGWTSGSALHVGHVFTHNCLLFVKDHRTLSFLVQATYQISAMLASFTFDCFVEQAFEHHLSKTFDAAAYLYIAILGDSFPH